MSLIAPARLHERQARLTAGLAMLGLTVSADQHARLLAFLDGLAKWNAVYNLTSVRDIEDMLPVHLLDSLAIVPLVDRWADGAILDVGSGAGLPGIPLAICRPALQVTTVDAVAKKVSFQLQMKATLVLANLHAVHRRVEALTLPQKPSLVISRAYAAISDMLVSIAALVDGATTVVAMKAGEPSAELARLPADWEVLDIEKLDVPFLGAPRCAVVLRRRRSIG